MTFRLAISVVVAILQTFPGVTASQPPPTIICNDGPAAKYQLYAPIDGSPLSAGPQERVFVYSSDGVTPDNDAGPFIKIIKTSDLSARGSEPNLIRLSLLGNFNYFDGTYMHASVMLVSDPMRLSRGTYSVEVITKTCGGHSYSLGVFHVE
jgi:hypothetical protein